MRRLLFLALLASGCTTKTPPAETPPAETPPVETATVRAVYEKTVYDGAAATFDHEAIPGVMDAMRMDFPLPDSSVVAGIAPGTKVRLTLQTEPRIEVMAVEALPDTTTLHLAAR